MVQEWAVRDQVIGVGNGTHIITTWPFIAYEPDQPAWMRVTLARQPAPVNPTTGLADGRGPAGGYDFGETEDYVIAMLLPDLGDAPDSDFNHYSANTTAYTTTGVLGHFPTVWGGAPAGEPSGHLHLATAQVWQGDHVTGEVEADMGPDDDGLNNILDGGADNADNDGADDGWLNPDTIIADCAG